MTDNTNQSGKEQAAGKVDHAGSKTAGKSVRAEAAPRAPMTVKGQKYVSPPGRHSQQSHRRAEEHAAADGNTTEREQHDHDRSAVLAGFDKQAQQKQTQQREQTERNAGQKTKAVEPPAAS